MDLTKGMLLNQGEGESFWVLGDLYTFKITGKQTNGAFTLIDQKIQPGSGPPPHIHHEEDEAFYVLDGSFSFLCAETHNICERGAFAYIPRGTLHTFKNIGESVGRLLVTITPAGLEEFFYAIGTPAIDIDTPPAFDAAVLDKIMQLADNYKMSILLPEG